MFHYSSVNIIPTMQRFAWICSVFGALLFLHPAHAQQSDIDSLLRVIRQHEASGRVDTSLVRALNSLAFDYDGYKSDSALALVIKAHTLAERLGYTRGGIISWIYMGNIYETQGQYNNALSVLFQALDLATTTKDTSLIIKAHNSLGIVYADKGEFQSALTHYFSSLKLAEAKRDSSIMSISANNIAASYQKLNRPTESLRYYRYAFTIAELTKRTREIAFALGNMGLVYADENQNDSALQMFREAYQKFKTIGDRRMEATQLVSIGVMYRRKSDYSQSLEALGEALEIQKDIGERVYHVETLFSIAQTLLLARRHREALIYARRAVDSAVATRAKKIILGDALGVLSMVYDSLGRYKEALAAHQRMAIVTDSMLTEESLNKSMQLQAEYEAEKKDVQILAMTKDGELRNKERVWMSALAIALAVVVLTLVSFYRLKIRSEKKAKKLALFLEEKNGEILRQQEVLEEQAREIEQINNELQGKYLVLEQQMNLQTDYTELRILNKLVHPHFLFNTLNSIYALSLAQSPKTPSMMLKLADLMRYLLVNSERDEVSLKDEVAYLENYITLEKLRLNENTAQVRFKYQINDLHSPYVPPLLFLPFVENAFKHGAATQIDDIHISIEFVLQGNEIFFYVYNTKPLSFQSPTSTNTGLANVRKRLQILFPERHDLQIEETISTFEVRLWIRL
ncbi:MAG: tetratricopeptide repeat protein [Candidatus Kapaibacteriota bacterium]